MKRFLVLRESGDKYAVTDFDTIGDAVAAREEYLPRYPTVPIIVEVIPPIDAYAMAKREAVLAELAAATKGAT